VELISHPDGEMELWRRASMFFLEDASSLDSRFDIQHNWSGLFETGNTMEPSRSGRGPLGSGSQTIALVQLPCLFTLIVSRLRWHGLRSSSVIKGFFLFSLYLLLMSLEH